MIHDDLKAKIVWAGKQAWHEGNVDAFDEIYDSDYVWHRPPFPDLQGLEAVKQSVAETRQAYSDIEFTYGEMVAEGDCIAYRYQGTMKHTGESPTLGIPPTGNEVTLKGYILVRVQDGKIVEEYEYSDYLGFLQQLGVIPQMG